MNIWNKKELAAFIFTEIDLTGTQISATESNASTLWTWIINSSHSTSWKQLFTSLWCLKFNHFIFYNFFSVLRKKAIWQATCFDQSIWFKRKRKSKLNMKFFGNRTSCVHKHTVFPNSIIYINVYSYTVASIYVYFFPCSFFKNLLCWRLKITGIN